jgi:hypothetical protein
MIRHSEPIVKWGQNYFHLIRGDAVLLLLIVGNYTLLRVIIL